MRQKLDYNSRNWRSNSVEQEKSPHHKIALKFQISYQNKLSAGDKEISLWHISDGKKEGCPILFQTKCSSFTKAFYEFSCSQIIN